jgi:hypothetical protein
VTLSAAVAGNTVSLAVYLSSSTAGTFTASITGSGLSVSAVNTTSPTTGYVTVYAYSGGLSANTYSGSLLVYLTPNAGGSTVSQTIPFTFVVGTGVIATPGIVTPPSLTFAYQTGTAVSSTTLPSQNIVFTGTGTFAVSAPIYGSGQPTGWLAASPNSTYGPATISVSVAPGALAANTTPYTATLTVTPTGGNTSTVSISLLVTPSPVLVAYPGSLNFTYTAGGANPYSPLYLNASDNSAMAVSATSSATWLSVSAPTQPNTGTVVSINGNNVASLANGVYTGTITVTAANAANSPVNVPVVLTVVGSTATGGGSLTLSSSSMTFSAQQSGSAPASQTLSVSASTNTSYTATASSSGNWLSVSPTGSLTTGANPSLMVSVNQSGLTALGSPYYGAITLVANGVTQTVQVTLVVSTASTGGGAGNVTVTANSSGTPSLNLTRVGGSTPSQFRPCRWLAHRARRPFRSRSRAAPPGFRRVFKMALRSNTPVTFTVSVRESERPRGWTLQRHHHHHADRRDGGDHSGQPDGAGGADDNALHPRRRCRSRTRRVTALTRHPER